MIIKQLQLCCLFRLCEDFKTVKLTKESLALQQDGKGGVSTQSCPAAVVFCCCASLKVLHVNLRAVKDRWPPSCVIGQEDEVEMAELRLQLTCCADFVVSIFAKLRPCKKILLC